ncbi:MAG: DNA polymerase III subunit alpha [Firmicutes bacterium]|nr:DNA polymerase III subunit alpha [Bacillota bacterium]
MISPLFIKTENSLLSSLIKIDDLINYAVENKIEALTITDNNMYGALEFYIKCKKNNIKPIIGLEIYDIVLYAINYEGYKNLIKLSTINSKDEINLDDLKKYSNDLVCIVPYKSIDKYDELDFYKYIFKGYGSLDEKHKSEGNLVYFKEILYLEKKDMDYLKYLFAIKKGISAKEIDISKYDNCLLDYKLYDLENNEKIVSLCNLELPFKEDLLPVYDTGDIDSFTYLKNLVKEGIKKIFGNSVSKVYQDRLKYELDIINKMGFCNYFLVVADYVKYAKESGIMVGPGRGSAAGSLVSFCLGITTIDPIKYDLLFERFLNPERISMPDIDIDFEYDRREDVIKYCMDKYGLKKVAPIITFGTLGSKQVIRDVGKSLNIDNKIIDNLSKLIDPRLSLIENYNTNNKIKKLLDSDNLKRLYKICLKLEGLKRHSSIHAAGVVMSRYDLDEIIPLDYHDTFYTTAYSMEYLEDIGLLKMDFLALKNLSLINNVLKEINIDFDDIPLNDEKAINIFTNVDTVGIFQFESKGMINFLNKFKPTSFDDVVAAIALFRPGPMGNIDTYINRKKGLEKVNYIHDSLKPILSSTYGIIIYQEQIMQIANVMAGYSLAEADLLRKAMSKKKEDILIKEKDKFVNKSVLNGYTKEVALEVYELILKFASYGFNKAHSVSYAMIAYKMAYLKAHYYPIFMKHLLSMVIGSDIKTNEYINACKGKINIVKPDINLSDIDYKVVDNDIIYPLTNIKNVGYASSLAIITERKKGKFKDIFDFFSRCYGKSVNSKVIENLIKAGCFSSFYNQKTIDNNLEALINYSELGSLLEDSLKPSIINLEEYDEQELLNREYEVFRMYLSSHPSMKYKKEYNCIDLCNVEKNFDKNVKCVILVDRVSKVTTKNNDIMLFITGSDETSFQEFVIFPKNYREIHTKELYFIDGKVEKRYDKYQIIVNNLRRIENE